MTLEKQEHDASNINNKRQCFIYFPEKISDLFRFLKASPGKQPAKGKKPEAAEQVKGFFFKRFSVEVKYL